MSEINPALDVHAKLLIGDVLLFFCGRHFEVVLLLDDVASVMSIFVVVHVVDDDASVATISDIVFLVDDVVFVVTIFDIVLLVHDVDYMYVVVFLLDDADGFDEFSKGFATGLDVKGLVGDALCKLFYEHF